MKVCLVGAHGNMGRRYTAVLKFLGHEIIPIDVEESLRDRQSAYRRADGILIATPTDDHVRRIFEIGDVGSRHVPILCEKPIATDLVDVRRVVNWARQSGFNLQMVNQYEHIDGYSSEFRGKSFYRYFNSGKDGLGFDCINILGLATDGIELSNESHVWRCRLNGSYLKLKDMDHAYLAMVESWLKRPIPNLDYILHAHQKAHDYVSKRESSHRHPG